MIRNLLIIIAICFYVNNTTNIPIKTITWNAGKSFSFYQLTDTKIE